jgi:gamma-resorcylate decarboxylase
MKTADNQENRITRRDLFKWSVGTVAAAGALAGASAADAASDSHEERATVPTESAPIAGKIALEEHFDFPETENRSYAAAGSPEFRKQIEDLGSTRIAEMDRGGLEICILSLVGPGIQAIPDAKQAIEVARHANDHLAEHIAKNPKRLKGFAALPLQDPQAAAQELTRCVKDLGFCGAMVNGFTETGQVDSLVFYDLPPYRDFWATVQQLDVPFYLHPRSPLAKNQPIYEGNPWLTGSIWGFTAEASIHALRLMGSGLFDDYPKLKIIIGHLGEGLPCSMWRIDNRIARTLAARPKAKLPMGH